MYYCVPQPPPSHRSECVRLGPFEMYIYVLDCGYPLPLDIELHTDTPTSVNNYNSFCV